MNTTMKITRADDFEMIVAEELAYLRAGEKRLQQMYCRLHSSPQLLDRFKSDLAEMRQRVDRLHAVLNPFGAFGRASAAMNGAVHPTAA